MTLQKRTLAELHKQPKPTNAEELEILSEWYFGKALHLSKLYCMHHDSAGSASYEVLEKYNSYHGKGWHYSENSGDGYDYSAAFWDYVVGELYCGGIAVHSYGQVRVKTTEDVERLINFWNNSHKQ